VNKHDNIPERIVFQTPPAGFCLVAYFLIRSNNGDLSWVLSNGSLNIFETAQLDVQIFKSNINPREYIKVLKIMIDKIGIQYKIWFNLCWQLL